MITLNYRDSQPIYLQVKEELKKLIVTGILPPGEKLPSVRALASSLALNPNTIQRSYELLEREGYAYSVPGKGSFAAEGGAMAQRQRQEALEKFDALARQLKQLGITREELIQRLQQCEGGEQA